MKKLMIAAAIVCAAAMSQAASVYWTCKEVQEGGKDVSGVAYFIDANVLSQQSLLALAGQGVDKFTAALGADYKPATYDPELKNTGAYSFTGADGSFAKKSSAPVPDATLGLKDSSLYNAYLVIFDTDTITDKSNFYVTQVLPVQTLAGAEDAQSVKWGSQMEASNAQGAWNAVGAVPEPTSGLLLLLGVAGLALRRRRA